MKKECEIVCVLGTDTCPLPTTLRQKCPDRKQWLAGQDAGRREVVEDMESELASAPYNYRIAAIEAVLGKWQAKLKKLGAKADNLTREEAGEIVRLAFGRRPDLPSGKEFVDRVRRHKEDK